MQDRKLLASALALLAFVATATLVSVANGPSDAVAGSSTPTATPCPINLEPDPNGDGCVKVTITMTPTAIPCPTDMVYDPYVHACVPITPTRTPCPTGKVPDSYHGAGCGTPTATPTSIRPAMFTFDLTVNGEQGPITVPRGARVLYQWDIVNLRSWPLDVVVKDDTYPELDQQCSRVIYPGQCGIGLDTPMLVLGTVTDTAQATGVSSSPCAGCPPLTIEDSVTVNVVSLPGDFNCDASVNSIDAAIILQISAGMIVPLPCTGDGDVNHDGDLTAVDAALILQYTARLITEFP